MRSFLARSEPLSCAGQNGRLASDDLRLSLIDLIIPSVDTCGEVNHQGGSGGHPALDRAPSRSGKRRGGCGSGLWSSPDGFAVFHRPIGSVLQDPRQPAPVSVYAPNPIQESGLDIGAISWLSFRAKTYISSHNMLRPVI